MLAAATLAFTTPATIWYGISALDTTLLRIDNIRHPRLALVVAGSVIILGVVAPFAGYAFLKRPFGRWEEFDRGTLLLVIFLSVAYWNIYGWALLFGVMALLYGLQE